MTDNKKTFLVIDSNALLHRAFHALPPLTTEKGEQTGAIYGFLLTLFRAIKDIQPKFIIACFDHPAPTFRHRKFKNYKSQRPKTPEDLVNQIPKVKKILEKLKIPILEKKGFEADDLIATICTKTLDNKENEIEIYIMSGDTDVFQLVNDDTKVYTLGKGIKETVIYDKEKIVSRFSLAPSQLIDFKALTGDPSDNIPGVSGVGKKTATTLLKEFGTLENLYQNLESSKISPKTKKSLLEDKKQAFLAKDLIRTKQDVSIDIEMENCRFGIFDKREAEEALKILGFKSLISRLSDLSHNSSDTQLLLI